jgi:hypothetical protein
VFLCSARETKDRHYTGMSVKIMFSPHFADTKAPADRGSGENCVPVNKRVERRITLREISSEHFVVE